MEKTLLATLIRIRMKFEVDSNFCGAPNRIKTVLNGDLAGLQIHSPRVFAGLLVWGGKALSRLVVSIYFDHEA